MRVTRIESLEKFKQLFLGLEPESDTSYFQSWGWVESGLNLFEEEKVLLVAMVGDEVVGLAPFFINHIKRSQFISSKALYLNEAENSRYDMFVEYNGFLVKRGLEAKVADAFLEYLINSDIAFDEIIINRVLSNNPVFRSKALENSAVNVRVTESEFGPSMYVDLKKIRENQQSFISTLNKNHRSKLRRTLKKYKELGGEVVLHCASDVDEALQYFRALGEWHQKYWVDKGESSAFVEKGWIEFHESMIVRRFEFSEIQMLKISVGHDVLGYIYNLVHRGQVYSIQAVFNYLPDNAFRPGYVCDSMAISYNLDQGADMFNFLIGESSYKNAFCNASDMLCSLVIQKKKLKFKLEKIWLRLKKCIPENIKDAIMRR